MNAYISKPLSFCVICRKKAAENQPKLLHIPFPAVFAQMICRFKYNCFSCRASRFAAASPA